MTTRLNPSITINDRTVGPENPAYIVAEMSANHNRDYEQAVMIIEAAKESGADALFSRLRDLIQLLMITKLNQSTSLNSVVKYVYP